MMTEQFSSMDLVCCGKKVCLPKGKHNRSAQFEYRMKNKAQDPPPISDNGLFAISYPLPISPKQRVSSQTSNQTPLPAAPLTFNVHFQRPSPPSPLVNTPLSGKRLPILVKMRNMTSIYSRHGDVRRNDEPARLDMYGGGDSLVSTVLNRILLKETNAKPGDILDLTKYTSPRSTFATYTSPSIAYTSPLTISPLGLQSKATGKATGKASDTAADSLSKTNIGLVLGAKCEKKDDHGPTSGDKVDCAIISGWKDNNCATNVDYWSPETNEISSSANKGTLNIIGSKLQTPKQRCPKVEAQKCPKVKYSRGVSTTGALYAFCCRAPYKARVRGVPPNVSVCPQHAICYSKNISVKSTSKVESLFKFTEEDIAVKEINRLTTDDNTRVNRFLLNKPLKSDSKKKDILNVEGKKLKQYGNSNFLTVTDHVLHGSQRAFSKNQTDSRKANRLSLHDDFPFHCFLLFQFEDRKKVMTRLSKLPMRYEQHLNNRQRGDTSVKSTETPKVHSQLIRKLGKNIAHKLRKIEDEKMASNEYGDRTSLHRKSTDLHEDVVGCQLVQLLQHQTDRNSQGIIPPKDIARSSNCEFSLEQSSVDASRTVFNRTANDSFWRNYETNENSYRCPQLVEKVLSTLQDRTSSRNAKIARTDIGDLCVNVLTSGLACESAIDHISFNKQAHDLDDSNSSFEEIHDRELEEKEACLNSYIPNKSESRLLINKYDNKEEECLEVKSINDASQSFQPVSEMTFQFKDEKDNVTSDFIHSDQSMNDTSGKENLKTSNCNDLSSEASCLSSTLCVVLPSSLIEGNDDGITQENAPKTKLIEGASGDRTKESTVTEVRRFKLTNTLSNTVTCNNRKYNSMSADANVAKKALPLISTTKSNSTFTEVHDVTPSCAQDGGAPCLPIIMDNSCRSKRQDGISPRKYKGSENLRASCKLRPKSCFCRTELVVPDEIIGPACQIKLPSATESISNKTRCFYSESPDSGISVKSGNSASDIPTGKVICLEKRNRADVKPHADDKYNYQEPHFNAEKQHSSLNSKTLAKLDIVQSSVGSNVNVNNLQSGFDSQLSDKDVSAYASSIKLTNRRPSAHCASLNHTPIQSNNMTIKVDSTQSMEVIASSITDHAVSNTDTASSVTKFPVCSHSKAQQAKFGINKMELIFKTSDVIPLPKVTSDIQTRSSTEYCNGTKLHRRMRHKAGV